MSQKASLPFVRPSALLLPPQIQTSKKKTGVIAPKRFVQRLKRDNEAFRSYMHQVRRGRRAGRQSSCRAGGGRGGWRTGKQGRATRVQLRLWQRGGCAGAWTSQQRAALRRQQRAREGRLVGGA
jgi:hypothetical protein